MSVNYVSKPENRYQHLEVLLKEFRQLNAASTAMQGFIEDFKSNKIKEDLSNIEDNINDCLWVNTEDGDVVPALSVLLAELTEMKQEQQRMGEALKEALLYVRGAADTIRKLTLGNLGDKEDKNKEIDVNVKEPASVDKSN
jgi:hypothetical protein